MVRDDAFWKRLRHRVLPMLLLGIGGSLSGYGCSPGDSPTPKPDSSAELQNLVQALRSDDWGDRYAAAASLAERGREAVPALVALFHGENDRVRQSAIWAIGQMRRGEAEGATDALAVLVLNDPVFKIRRFAVSALANVHPRDEGSVECLLAALSDPHPAVRAAAASGFADYFAEEEDAQVSTLAWLPDLVGALRDLLSDKDALVRTSSACALGEIGREAGEAAPDLARLQSDEYEDARYWAAVALARLGSNALDVEILREASGSSVEGVRKAAAEALTAADSNSENP